MLCRRDDIVSSLLLRLRRTTHKYGIEVPTLIVHVKRLDTKNGNTYCQDSIAKEMANVGIAFTIQDEDI